MNFQNPYLQNPNGITWVQGIEAAKSYQLSPNSNILLMDSENDGRFYIKVSDNVGMCTIRTFKYEEIKPSQETYITKDDLAKAINELKEALKNEQSIQPVKQQRTLITE